MPNSGVLADERYWRSSIVREVLATFKLNQYRILPLSC